MAEPVPQPAPLQEGRDYTVDGQGLWVFTAGYLRGRGYCCFQGCRHCPWGLAGQSRAQVFAELQRRLERLEALLQGEGLPVDVEGYRDGVLRVRAPREACAGDLPGLARTVLGFAARVIPAVQVQWC